MTISIVIAAVLLSAGVAVVWLAALSLLRLSTPLDRLHGVCLGGVGGSAMVAMAVLVMHPADAIGLKAVLLAAIVWCCSSLLSHAQASLAHRLCMSGRQPSSDEETAT